MGLSMILDPIGVVSLVPPVVAAHGGAGSPSGVYPVETWKPRLEFIETIVRDAWRLIHAHPTGDGLREAVLHAIDQMELDGRFNAGIGSKLQRDGNIRVSAAMMDGRRLRLSGVYNVQHLLHAGRLADALQSADSRNLDGEGGRALMERLGIAPVNLATPGREAEWREKSRGQTGTVGAVGVGDRPLTDTSETDTGSDTGMAIPIFACTSTGGRGYETPGRISDTPTPAGNYACPEIAISATGVGENILDLNLCGRLSTRVIDGMPLADALDRCRREALALGAQVGLIAVTKSGEFGWLRTTPAMPAVALGAGADGPTRIM